MNPAQTLSLLQTAVEHHQAGRLAEADRLYAQVRTVAPRNFDALHLAGMLALQQGRTADAVGLLAKAQKVDPHSAVCTMRLGATFNAAGRFAEGADALQQALRLDPNLPEAALHLGHAQRALGRIDDALHAYARALEINPANAEAHEVCGALLADTRGAAAAEPHLRRAVELEPGRACAWANLGIILTNLGRLGEALACLDRSLALDPKLHHAHAGRGIALERSYEIAAAVEAHGRAVAGNPRNLEARSARLIAQHYLDGIPCETLFEEHLQFGRMAGEERGALLPNSLEPERRLRVAIVSPDLRAHSVAYFLEPLLKHLDPEKFEIYLYHDHAQVDAMSARLRNQAALWRHVAGLTHDALEKIIRADVPDIAIDLAGHTGLNRLALFARRIAPVQISYLGYPDTTGVTAMDYRFVDARSDPEGDTDWYHSEKLVRFAPSAWAYAPPEFAPDPVPRVTESGIVFGCFNNFSKITDKTLRVWARLLDTVPGSRLLLKGHGLGTSALQESARRRFAMAGLAADRVELLERTRTQAEHLAVYARVDVALDTFPYHGTTTTCEALWMGVPVVTLAGDRHASRVGASLLHSAGHPEWVAQDWDGYVDRAVKLANDPVQRFMLLGSLRDELRRSALLDHAAFGAHFGSTLREVWREKCGVL